MNEIVAPTLRELRDDRRLRRHACIAVSHVKDYLREASESDIEAAMQRPGPIRWPASIA